jgi:hypothetical protein
VAIKKEAYYEGAALQLLARANVVTELKYEAPFYIVDGGFLLYLKYSTKGRSPWPFTFTPDEQALLRRRAAASCLAIGLVCGFDGVVALSYDAFVQVASTRGSAIRISCYRQRGEHYELNGPDGTFDRKIAPSNWIRILEHRGDYETP